MDRRGGVQAGGEPAGEGPGGPDQRRQAKLPGRGRRGYQRLGGVRVPRQASQHLDPERLGDLAVGVTPATYDHQPEAVPGGRAAFEPGRNGLQVGQAGPGDQHRPLALFEHPEDRRGRVQPPAVHQHVRVERAETGEPPIQHPERMARLVGRGRPGQHRRPPGKLLAVLPHQLGVAAPAGSRGERHQARLGRPARRPCQRPARRVGLDQQHPAPT